MATSKNHNLDTVFDGTVKLVKLTSESFIEAFKSFKYNLVPLIICCYIGILINIVILTKLDEQLFGILRLSILYPKNYTLKLMYISCLIMSPFFVWGLIQVCLKRKLVKRLTTTFAAIGLENRQGFLPGYVSDQRIDDYTRKLTLHKSHISIEKFRENKSSLQSSLQVYIDDMIDHTESGLIDIIYSFKDMPKLVEFNQISKMEKDTFVVGTTRTQELRSDLDKVPHLLVAGETSSGKSTFIRQLITSFYINNPEARFVLIDLKGGLEFQLFKPYFNRMSVAYNNSDAVSKLKDLSTELSDRMELLTTHSCKDIQEYWKKRTSNKERKNLKNIDRIIVVIDEVAELFMAHGKRASQGDAIHARNLVSRLTRLGRAVGIHVIVATQRPDANVLDTQIKANLTAKVCFQMADISSSMVVLNNKRAKDLPSIPGRAIWQNGLDMREVQTPLLTVDEAKKLLNNKKETKE